MAKKTYWRRKVLNNTFATLALWRRPILCHSYKPGNSQLYVSGVWYVSPSYTYWANMDYPCRQDWLQVSVGPGPLPLLCLPLCPITSPCPTAYILPLPSHQSFPQPFAHLPDLQVLAHPSLPCWCWEPAWCWSEWLSMPRHWGGGATSL